MIAKEANAISVYLSVDGEKLEEHHVKKTGNDQSRRMECFVIPKPNSKYVINVRLGRQTPWVKDFVAEPSISGQATHSLHVRRKWHRSHTMVTLFEEDEDGGLLESELNFGRVVDPQNEVEEGADSSAADAKAIVVAISRAEIERIKPAKKRIKQLVKNRENRHGDATTGRLLTLVSCVAVAGGLNEGVKRWHITKKTTYQEGDSSENPFVKFVFKVRSHQYLYARGLIEKKPAQQHPAQVSRSVRIKAEPGDDYDEPPPRNQTHNPYSGSTKREHDDEDIRSESEAAKRCRMYERKIQQLEDMVRSLRQDRFGSGQSSAIRGSNRRDAISVAPSEDAFWH
ncbi:hypothetical protein IAU59_000469 [Kwoniella sp. CBS 9459]